LVPFTGLLMGCDLGNNTQLPSAFLSGWLGGLAPAQQLLQALPLQPHVTSRAGLYAGASVN
jgi:hypothetical protein